MFIVTGANGFIGSAMVWELNQNGHNDIICCDTISFEERRELLEPLRFTQFVTPDKLWDFLEKTSGDQVQGIFHMGACSSTTEMDEEFLKRNNTDFTNRLFSWCAENQCTYIYASSAATYGAGEQGFDDELDSRNLKPLNPYGWSKLNSDTWVMEQSHTPAHWYGLRFFNVFGPNEYFKGEQSSVVFKAFNQINETEKLKLFRSHHPDYQDGMQVRDFVYVKDVTRWMMEMWSNKPSPGIYNMGFGESRTWNDLAGATFLNMKKEMQIEWIDIPELIRDKYQYYTEAKMTKLIGAGLSAPQWSLEKGIADYINNYLNQETPYLVSAK